MDYHLLGNNGFMISGVIMGGNTIAADNYDHVLRALYTGINYLVTDLQYGRGRSEEDYAKVIQSRPRDSLFLNTKVSVWNNNRNEFFEKILIVNLNPSRRNCGTWPWTASKLGRPKIRTTW